MTKSALRLVSSHRNPSDKPSIVSAVLGGSFQDKMRFIQAVRIEGTRQGESSCYINGEAGTIENDTDIAPLSSNWSRKDHELVAGANRIIVNCTTKYPPTIIRHAWNKDIYFLFSSTRAARQFPYFDFAAACDNVIVLPEKRAFLVDILALAAGDDRECVDADVLGRATDHLKRSSPGYLPFLHLSRNGSWREYGIHTYRNDIRVLLHEEIAVCD